MKHREVWKLFSKTEKTILLILIGLFIASLLNGFFRIWLLTTGRI